MSDVRAGMMIAGKYRIEAVLARGGMGSIWRARHLGLDTPVAVKFIGADVFAQKDARRRFEREAKAAAQLQSAHVVHIHDYGVEGDVPYLVMELLDGEDLGVRLRRRTRLGLEETVNVVTQVARALRRAADAGIVHRDLKPSNVFIVRGDEDEELVKVLDFGVAKTVELRLDEDTTQSGAILGSPRYMSPEQARGSRLVDPRSDLWSLGVIAYRALTGQLPFTSQDVPDLVLKICSETAAPPSSHDPALSPEVDAFFVRALERDPARRFQTAREMAVALALAAGLPPSSQSSFRVLARPPFIDADPPPSSPRLGGERPGGRTTQVPAAPSSSPRWSSAPNEPIAVPSPDHARASGSPPPREPSAPPARPSEPTRISGPSPPASPPLPRPEIPSVTTAEPAASRSGTRPVETSSTLHDGTTPDPGCVDVSVLATVGPSRQRLAHCVAVLASITLACGALVLAPWRRPSAPAAAGSLAPPESPVGARRVTTRDGLTPSAAPVEPTAAAPTATSAAAAPTTSAATTPAATTADPTAAPVGPQPPRAPVNRGGPQKKLPNPVLGI